MCLITLLLAKKESERERNVLRYTSVRTQTHNDHIKQYASSILILVSRLFMGTLIQINGVKRKQVSVPAQYRRSNNSCPSLVYSIVNNNLIGYLAELLYSRRNVAAPHRNRRRFIFCVCQIMYNV